MASSPFVFWDSLPSTELAFVNAAGLRGIRIEVMALCCGGTVMRHPPFNFGDLTPFRG